MMYKKKVLVTGASRGIGASICKKLAKNGYYLYISSRPSSKENMEKLLNKIEETGGKGKILYFDISSEEDIQKTISQNIKNLDVLINNAGINKDNLVISTSEKDWLKIIQTNFLGMVNCFKHCLPALRQSKDARVVNMASISGFLGGKGQCSYAASKAMVIEWSKEMSKTFKEQGIKFYSISPGPIKTEMIKSSSWYQHPQAKKIIPIHRFGEPEEIADLIHHLLQSPNNLYNGINWVVDGGFTLSTK